MEAYLDNSATTCVYQETADLVCDLMVNHYGNPSAMHQKGVEAEQYIRTAQETLAKILKVKEKEIFFTSGGTESDNWALVGTAMANKRTGNHIITSAIEHPAVSAPLAFLEEQGFRITRLPVNKEGLVDVNELEEAITPETILDCCRTGYGLGFRTFVLQGGEDPAWDDGTLTALVAEIRRRWSDCAITLSLGERSAASYEALFRAGATRYLLRHETADPQLYAALHPAEMSHARRLACLETLRRIGYQTGTGMMVGVPGQTIGTLVEDLLLIERLRPQMIGIGPFLPHGDTPLGHAPAGSLRLTLLLLAILRLMRPAALIPATTALATLSPEGRRLGILSGANVVMPNLSPAAQRAKYAIYEHKAAFGCEAAEGLAALERELASVGYRIDYARGDYEE